MLEFVYDESGGGTSASVPIAPYAAILGLDIQGAYTIAWACTDAGLALSTSSLSDPRLRMTPAGLERVLDRKRRRSDPAQRSAACRTELLRWFYRQQLDGVHLPVTGEFADTIDAFYEGTKFTDMEIQLAAEYLTHKSLIAGVAVAEMRGPVRAEITHKGIDCVTESSGDVSVFLRDQRGSGPQHTYHGPYIQGDAPNAQMAWNSSNFSQKQDSSPTTPGFEPLAEALADLIRSLPMLGLSDTDRQDVIDAADEVAAEVVRDQPNQGRLRRSVAAIRHYLAPIAAGAVVGVSDQARVEAAELVDKIASAVSG
ncbi:hypothetical protein [Paractinoplanes bogorensis]|uniref:hypothetical protein n=1 Tax=Paractinoplanes bogorensis TaxID=1610840 RepID=UPI0027E02416|nr:hypothetical protein [Actinoplanes bogorensis]